MTYRNQRPMRKAEVAYLGPTGPPNSAFPKTPTIRRTIRMAMVEIAHIVKTVTLKARSPAGTAKPPSVSWKKIQQKN